MNLIKFIKCRLIVKHRIPTPPPTEPVKTNKFAGFNLVKFLNTYSEPIHAAWLVMGRLNNGNSRYLRWRADRQDVYWNVMASGWNLIFAGQFIIAWKRVIESFMDSLVLIPRITQFFCLHLLLLSLSINYHCCNILPVPGITIEYTIPLTAFSSTSSPSKVLVVVNWRRTIQLANKVLCGCGKRFSGGGRSSTGWWSHSRILVSLRSIQTTLYHPTFCTRMSVLCVKGLKLPRCPLKLVRPSGSRCRTRVCSVRSYWECQVRNQIRIKVESICP